jgi:hypothetical protein
MGRERRIMLVLAVGVMAAAAVLLLLTGERGEVQLPAALAAGVIAAALAWAA